MGRAPRARHIALPRLSRRRILVAAASVGVGTAAAGVTGISLAQNTAGAQAPAPDPGPLVLSLRDGVTGTFELYHGSRKVRVTDPALLRTLLAALPSA
jgi:hypothetical protein